MTPEFSRPVPIARIGPNGLDVTVEATAGERSAVARRLDLPAIPLLSCHFRLMPADGATIAAEAWLTASVTQTCVVSLDEFTATLAEHFTLRFVPAGTETDDIDPEAEDEVPIRHGTIDLGEAATEQLALGLDPWPRKPGATLPDSEADAPPGPFATLARRPS